MTTHHTKSDYISFDRFIKTKIRDGTLYVDMPEIQLREALRNMGIHVKCYYDDSGRKQSPVNVYPTYLQVDRVKDIIGKRTVQEKIDKSIFYSRDKRNNYHAKVELFYNNKKYRKGQFIPRKYGES
jgi:hypothetical protein